MSFKLAMTRTKNIFSTFMSGRFKSSLNLVVQIGIFLYFTCLKKSNINELHLKKNSHIYLIFVTSFQKHLMYCLRTSG